MPIETPKPTLHLTGPSVGMPTAADIAAMVKAITGKAPSAEAMQKATRMLAGEGDATATAAAEVGEVEREQRES